MKAVAVTPGKPNSVHLADLSTPSVRDVPHGRGVLVKVLRVGVDGTDREINAAEYGAAPAGDDFLVLGHESFGRVEAVGPQVTELQPGDYVVATVRRVREDVLPLVATLRGTADVLSAFSARSLLGGVRRRPDVPPTAPPMIDAEDTSDSSRTS